MSAPAESAELLGASSRERESERVLLSAACTSVTSALFFLSVALMKTHWLE